MKNLSFNISATFDEMDRLNQTTETAKSAIKKETAKINYDTEGVCPYCKNKMVRSFAAGQPVHLCQTDRYVAPMSNEELARVESEAQLPSFQFTD